MSHTITACGIYDALLNEDKILELDGKIQFYLGDVDIIVKQKDVVGNIMQEWLQGWLEKRGYFYKTNTNSQMPPDFFLEEDNDKQNLLEVKAFNREATPAFDIADFRMYAQEIVTKPWMLDVDYLIFGYKMSDEGIVTIKEMWLKKVWEISRRMEKWPLNLQVKKKVVHKIRPGVWYRTPRSFKIFKSKIDFLSAVEHTVWQNPETRSLSGEWKDKFLKSYKRHYGKTLNIPRWDDIKDRYIIE